MMKMVDLREELKYIRVSGSAITGAIEDTVESINEGAKIISDSVQKTYTAKEPWEPSAGFQDYSAYINELLAKQEEMFRYGIDVTTKRYEDAIAGLGGKVTTLEGERDKLLDSILSLKGGIEDLSSASFQKQTLLGGIQTIVIIAILGIGGIFIAKELITK